MLEPFLVESQSQFQHLQVLVLASQSFVKTRQVSWTALLLMDHPVSLATKHPPLLGQNNAILFWLLFLVGQICDVYQYSGELDNIAQY